MKLVTRDFKLADIHDDLSEKMWFQKFYFFPIRMSESKHADKQLKISRFYRPYVRVWFKCLPSIQAFDPHHGGSILRSIVKV